MTPYVQIVSPLSLFWREWMGLKNASALTQWFCVSAWRVIPNDQFAGSLAYKQEKENSKTFSAWDKNGN